MIFRNRFYYPNGRYGHLSSTIKSALPLGGSRMLDKSMLDQLSSHLNLECYSFHLYLQMSAWCANQGFSGSAALLQRCAQGERAHLEKLLQYISETGSLPIIGTVVAPPYEFATLADLFQQLYEHEQSIAEQINMLAHSALTIQDYTTFNFLQWYLKEQHQEEVLFKRILDKLELIGEEGKSLFLLDQALQHLDK